MTVVVATSELGSVRALVQRRQQATILLNNTGRLFSSKSCLPSTDGDAENAGMENAGMENVGPNRRGGKYRTGKDGNIVCMDSET